MSERFSIGGQNFATLGVSGARLETATSQTGRLTLTLDRPIDATAAFSAYEKAVLVDHGDGGVVWTGWLDVPAIAANPREQNQLIFRGPAGWLDLGNYEQDIVVDDGNERVLAAQQAALLGRKIPDIESDAEKLTANALLTELKTQLLAQTGTVLTGTLPTLKLPWLPMTNATLGSCLLAILEWFPTYAFREVGENLALFDCDATASRPISELTKAVTAIRVLRRDDLRSRSVTLTYNQISSGKVTGQMVDTFAQDNGAQRAIKWTEDLEEGEPFPDAGLAEIYQLWRGRSLRDAQVTWLGDLAWDITPGLQAVLGGASADFAGDEPTIIQAISRDLFTGAVTLACGPRRHLGLDKLIELNRKKPRGAGSGPDPTAPPEEEPMGTINILILPDDGGGFFADDAPWTVDGQFGFGDGSVELPPGSYEVKFGPVVGFVRPPAVTVEVMEDAEVEAEGRYERAVASSQPFELVDTSIGSAVTIKIQPSTVFDQDAIELEFDASAGEGVAWVQIPFTPSTGAVGTASLHTGSDFPEGSDSLIIVPLGGWYHNESGALVPQNYRYGPITGYACRSWYADPAEWTLTIN